MSRILLEVAIETADDAGAAHAGGADRLEVCGGLDLGGLTPSRGTIDEIRERTILPLVIMIRPRGGDFVYSDSEIATMIRDIRYLHAVQPAAFVFGALTAAGEIHDEACRFLRQAAGDVPCVFHRAFDRTADNRKALEECIRLGFVRILTSGKATDALAGSTNIAKLAAQADGRIEILPCGRVRAGNAAEIVRLTGVTQVHGAFSETVPDSDAIGQRGYPSRSRTSREQVAACRSVLEEFSVR